MKQRHLIRWSSLLVVVLAGYGLTGCGEGAMAKAAGEDCLTSVSGYTSPAPGVVTLQGHFFDTESVLLRDATTHVQVAGGTPATDRSSFSLSGVPSGTHGYEVVVSCDQAGQVTTYSALMTVQ